MQTLALLLLLAITASTIFAFDGVLAQNATSSEEEITEEEIPEESEDEAVQDENVEEDTEVVEDDMEATMTEKVASPRQQLMSGTDPHEIQCADGMKLVFKASNFHPACIKESSYQVLLQRGWASDHDPSHEDLAEMMKGMPIKETDDTSNEEVEMDEKMNMEEESTMGNSTEVTPQSYTIELSEAMEMGAN
jgi:hypothetical protein